MFILHQIHIPYIVYIAYDIYIYIYHLNISYMILCGTRTFGTRTHFLYNTVWEMEWEWEFEIHPHSHSPSDSWEWERGWSGGGSPTPTPPTARILEGWWVWWWIYNSHFHSEATGMYDTSAVHYIMYLAYYIIYNRII